MHYVDEGPRDGRPVVLVHGNPTWGYLYRHFITPLVEAGYRVVVPDHLGFGRSDKPDNASTYTIPRHSERLIALMDSLGLEDATVVPVIHGNYSLNEVPEALRQMGEGHALGKVVITL